MSNKTYGAGNGRMTPAKANMRAMADGGGLAGFKNGGGAYDGLMKAQPGVEIPYPSAEMNSMDSAKFRVGYGEFYPGDGFAGVTEGQFANMGRAAKEKALLKAAKAKQRNSKPGPYQY
jgi:hypothetical protein